jgi:hypothetical protein
MNDAVILSVRVSSYAVKRVNCVLVVFCTVIIASDMNRIASMMCLLPARNKGRYKNEKSFIELTCVR